MTQNNERETFEKWAFSQGHSICRHHLDHNDYAETGTFFMWNAWQAATQVSESEINSLKQRGDELQADNLRLRDALGNCKLELEMQGCNESYADENSQFSYNMVLEALSSTPTQ